MKKKLIAGVCVLLALVLLFPIPYHLKDGGTVKYEAVLYNVQKVHRLNPDLDAKQEFLEGTVVEILGFEVFSNVE